MDLNNLAVAQLTFQSNYDESPSWSPDGKRIVYSSHRSGDGDLWILDVPQHPRWLKEDL